MSERDDVQGLPVEAIRASADALPDVWLEPSSDGRSLDTDGTWHGIRYSVRAVYARPGEADLRIYVDGQYIAHVTVHGPLNGQGLTDEVQAVSCGLLWSALRRAALRGDGPE